MTTAIIDYGSGNLRSAAKAFERASAELGLGDDVVVTDKAEQVASADRIVLPGVGAFADCRAGLFAVPGMTEALNSAVIKGGRPFLGICVGMQILGQSSDEGEEPGLGWIGGKIRALECRQDAGNVPLPHMGWNDVSPSQALPLLSGMQNSRFYFLHSYYFDNGLSENCGATANYGGDFTCIVNKDNVWGVQFHPEKSHHFGSNLLKNFAEL